ncbi:MAG: hypothetical protein N3B10_12365 [Armatimonadetes bacterium]|nr:hypothetical protein [Armatimonadota bacterium]
MKRGRKFWAGFTCPFLSLATKVHSTVVKEHSLITSGKEQLIFRSNESLPHQHGGFSVGRQHYCPFGFFPDGSPEMPILRNRWDKILGEASER